MTTAEIKNELVIKQTRCWLESFIIKHNICPFAKPVYEREGVHYGITWGINMERILEDLIDECVQLDSDDKIETSLLIYPDAFISMDDYIDFIALADELLIQQGYEGVYQLASFHPEYQFAETETDDPANFTNRSPYPMLHLIREASLEQALEHYPNPEQIPERNIKFTREQGLEKMQAILSHCQNLEI
ncbi:MAG: DUF1415 domain-containing protein [Gammaproteobacteria bacterium]|nr:DUF1415 domain-containing protein [Gammaproteobacteria bacterium]